MGTSLSDGSRPPHTTKTDNRPEILDPNPIEHLWDVLEQVRSTEAPSPQHTGPTGSTTNIPEQDTTGNLQIYVVLGNADKLPIQSKCPGIMQIHHLHHISWIHHRRAKTTRSGFRLARTVDWTTHIQSRVNRGRAAKAPVWRTFNCCVIRRAQGCSSDYFRYIQRVTVCSRSSQRNSLGFYASRSNQESFKRELFDV